MSTTSIPKQMRAMLYAGNRGELTLSSVTVPQPEAGELLVKVHACGVCRTDLHVIDGELTEPVLPVIPGHQIVGTVVQAGSGELAGRIGERVGVPWLGGSCGVCDYCIASQENLCDSAVYTGYQRNGGFAEYVTADAAYCFDLPAGFSEEQVAPLLCAGLIGYRAWRMAGAAEGRVSRIGLYGFGAAAHILAQIAVHQNVQTYAFTRRGDEPAQRLASDLGAAWVGSSDEQPPQLLDAAIIFAPDGALVPLALKGVRKGGRVVCAGIHMSDIPGFPYVDLWGERSLLSVANLTRQDGAEFLPLAAAIPVQTHVHRYALAEAQQALDDLRAGRFTGAAVVVP